MGDITRLLSELQQGNHRDDDKLMLLVYQNLRQMAARHFKNERPSHTLQPTALVHEAYIRLMQPDQTDWRNRAQFFFAASVTMRRILVEHARAHKAEKRGGGQEELELDEALVFEPKKSAQLIALDDALTCLEEFDPLKSQIVELRYFGGLSIAEAALTLNIGVTKLKREWNLAIAWLRKEMESI